MAHGPSLGVAVSRSNCAIILDNGISMGGVRIMEVAQKAERPDRLTAKFVEKVATPGTYSDGKGGNGLALLVRQGRGGGVTKTWVQRITVDKSRPTSDSAPPRSCRLPRPGTRRSRTGGQPAGATTPERGRCRPSRRRPRR